MPIFKIIFMELASLDPEMIIVTKDLGMQLDMVFG